jgi:hypothetical protein
LVTGYNGIGIHSFLAIQPLFQGMFKQFIFVSVGVIDSSRFKGVDEVEHLNRSTEDFLQRYVDFANRQGFWAESRYVLGTDTLDLLVDLCVKIVKQFPRAVFFSGKLIFQEETFLTRLLHNQAAATLQRRLQFAGLQMIVLPIRAL